MAIDTEYLKNVEHSTDVPVRRIREAAAEIERLQAERDELLSVLAACRGGFAQARKQERERCIEEVKMAMYGDDTRCEWNLALEHVVDVLSALEDE